MIISKFVKCEDKITFFNMSPCLQHVEDDEDYLQTNSHIILRNQSEQYRLKHVSLNDRYI